MRHAPAVTVLCRSQGWRRFQSLVFGLAATVFVAWALSHLQVVAPVSWLAACGLGGACAGLMGWWRDRAATLLVWDGAQWTVNGQVMRVELMLDMAGALLIRLSGCQPGHATTTVSWLGLSQGEAGPAWHGLRVALYAQHRRAVDNSAGPLCL